MKRANLLLVLLLVGLVGCTYNSLPDDMATPVAVSEQGFDLTFSTRAEAFDGVELDSEYFVAEQDLESYLNYKQKHSGKKINIKNYSAYGFDNSHTLFYVINYDKGWEVVSADKRTQPTLAYGDDERTFSMGADNTNEAEKLWMDMLASDVLQKRQRGKGARTSDTEEIANDEERAYVNYWNHISNTAISRGFIEGPVLPGDSMSGYTYAVGSVIDTVSVQYGPFLQTHWGQEYPWNLKCPDCMGSNNKAPAGCVAVAGGQLLYYLQQKYGARFPIPMSCTVIGDTDSHQYTFSNTLTSAIWGAMALTADEHDPGWSDGPTQLVATALAWIGDRIEMDYGDYYSLAFSNNLMNNVFSHLGVDWQYHEGYDLTILMDKLCEDKQPIYVEASQQPNAFGHAWIVDGYQGIQTTTTTYYVTVSSPMTQEMIDFLYDIEDGRPGTPVVTLSGLVHFNWGQNGVNDGYYGVLPEEWDPEEFEPSYQYDVDIYYNFSPTILLNL